MATALDVSPVLTAGNHTASVFEFHRMADET